MEERSWVQAGLYGWPRDVTLTVHFDLIEGEPVWLSVVAHQRHTKELLANWAWPIPPDTEMESALAQMLDRLREALEHASKPFG